MEESSRKRWIYLHRSHMSCAMSAFHSSIRYSRSAASDELATKNPAKFVTRSRASTNRRQTAATYYWRRLGIGKSKVRRRRTEGEHHDELTNCASAAREMRAGPSESASRSRLQTTPSCCGQKPSVVSVGVKAPRYTSGRYGSGRRTNLNLRRRVVSQRLVVKTRGVSISWDKLAGYLVTGRAATGV